MLGFQITGASLVLDKMCLETIRKKKSRTLAFVLSQLRHVYFKLEWTY